MNKQTSSFAWKKTHTIMGGVCIIKRENKTRQENVVKYSKTKLQLCLKNTQLDKKAKQTCSFAEIIIQE